MPIELLLNRHKMRPTLDYETRQGHTALTWASWNGRREAIEILIDRGAEINRCNIEGMTALMFAARNGKTDILRLLIELGADPSLQDINNKTALDHAEDHTDARAALSQLSYCNLGT